MAALLLPISLLFVLLSGVTCDAFEIQESTVDDIQSAFKDGRLTSRQLVQHYLHRIQSLNPLLHAVIELNPDALHQADRCDRERRSGRHTGGGLHGIPILLKDNIATRDRFNTTADSYALLGSSVPRDAGVVRRLRRAGAVILGKASLSEWANFRSDRAPNGWSARGGQGRNPYVLTADPCESSSGSAKPAGSRSATGGLEIGEGEIERERERDRQPAGSRSERGRSRERGHQKLGLPKPAGSRSETPSPIATGRPPEYRPAATPVASHRPSIVHRERERERERA